MATLANTKEGYSHHAVSGKFKSTTLPQLGCIWGSNLTNMKITPDRFPQEMQLVCSTLMALPVHPSPSPNKKNSRFSSPANIVS